MSETKIVSFDQPITILGRAYDSIVLKEPTTKQFMDSQKMTHGIPDEEGRMKQVHYLICKVAEVEGALVDAMPYSKFREASDVMLGFLMGGDPDGNSSSPV